MSSCKWRDDLIMSKHTCVTACTSYAQAEHRWRLNAKCASTSLIPTFYLDGSEFENICIPWEELLLFIFLFDSKLNVFLSDFSLWLVENNSRHSFMVHLKWKCFLQRISPLSLKLNINLNIFIFSGSQYNWVTHENLDPLPLHSVEKCNGTQSGPGHQLAGR